MKPDALYNLLKQTTLPVAYDHFKDLQGAPAPLPPFILYRTPDANTFKADDKIYYKQANYIIDLVTDKKDTTKEEALENILEANHLPYDKFEDFIENENIFQIRYFI